MAYVRIHIGSHVYQKVKFMKIKIFENIFWQSETNIFLEEEERRRHRAFMLYVKSNKSIALMSFALPFLQGSSIPWASFSNERKKLKELDSVTPSQKWRGGSEEE